MKEIKQIITGRIALILLFGILGFSVNGQELQKLEAVITQGGTSSSYTLEELVYGMVPSAKFNSNGLINQDGSSDPVRLFMTTDNFNDLYTNNTLYNSIELIFIQINDQNDLDQVLDLNQLSGFNSLEYVYFSLSFKPCGENGAENCQQRKVKLMTTGEPAQGVSLLYNAEYNN